jgi:allantoicase
MTPFTDLPDVASERLGGSVLLANDDFFAPKENLLKVAKPVWREDEYTDRGKWMDGWETRRRRTPGYDWCVIKLGVPAVVRGVVVDTSYFRGNYPEECSLEAGAWSEDVKPESIAAPASPGWREILARASLKGDAANPFPIDDPGTVTHLRLNIYPDGGVARLRVHGEPVAALQLRPGVTGDLAAIENGGLVLVSSDMFFGNRHQLIFPGRSTHMGDGWETKRRRGPGHDWSIVRLAGRGIISRIEVDTDHFKGNAPESCSIDICDAAGAPVERLTAAEGAWFPLLPRTPLAPHHRHTFPVSAPGPATHVRLAIYPDCGIARLRVFGTLAD